MQVLKDNVKEKIYKTAIEEFYKKGFLKARMQDIAKKAGVPWIHPHSFRHFYATNLLRSGAKITVVQELLGHANIETTARYLHVTESDLRYTIYNMPVSEVVRQKANVGQSKIDF